jgi:hypothetical protein
MRSIGFGSKLGNWVLPLAQGTIKMNAAVFAPPNAKLKKLGKS